MKNNSVFTSQVSSYNVKHVVNLYVLKILVHMLILNQIKPIIYYLNTNTIMTTSAKFLITVIHN